MRAREDEPRSRGRDEDRRAGSAQRDGEDEEAYRSRRGRRRDRRSPSGSPGHDDYRSRRGREEERHRRRSPSRSRSRSEDSIYERRRTRRRRFKSQWDVKPDAATLVAATALPGVATGAAPIASQATRHARRLYVGGLQPPIDQMALEEFFTTMVRERVQFVHNPLPPTARPVMSCFVSQERKFAFIEFATMELTAAMLSLDGVDYRGLPLRIKRPNDYEPGSLSAETRERSEILIVEGLGVAAAMGGAKMVGGSGGAEVRDRIFVGGLPSAVDEDGLGKIFESFGAVTSIHIVRDATGASKGFGFIELADRALIDPVCAQLNGIEIAGRKITVNRAKAESGTPGFGAATGGFGGGANPLAAMASGAMPGGPVMGPPPGVKATPGTAVCLEGVASPADTASPAALAALVSALADDLACFGVMDAIIVPRAPQRGVGRAFVQFGEPGAAATAAAALHGRTFGASAVRASLYDAAALASGEYDRPTATA